MLLGDSHYLLGKNAIPYNETYVLCYRNTDLRLREDD